MTDDLLWQFDLAWALADLHLSALVDDDLLWEPAPLCWTVRPDAPACGGPTGPTPSPIRSGAHDRLADLAHRLVVVGDHRSPDRRRRATAPTSRGPARVAAVRGCVTWRGGGGRSS